MFVRFFRIFFGLSFIATACVTSNVIPVQAAVSAGPIKGSGAVIFYLASNGRRYAFPNEQTYKTWYPSFSSVRVISDDEIAGYTYGGNVTYRPGTRLLKRRNDVRIYTVGRGGMLRWLTSESVVKALYGQNWRGLIDELPDSRVADYVFGDPVRTTSDVSPAAERKATPTVEFNRRPASSVPVQPIGTTSGPAFNPQALTNPARTTSAAPTSSTTRAPSKPVAWPGQVSPAPATRTTSNTPPTTSNARTATPAATVAATPPVDLSAYPGARRAVNATTESTLRSALQNAHAGDVIRVSGSYTLTRQLAITGQGTSANPIYIVAANGKGTARITVSGDKGLAIGGTARYVIIDGLFIGFTGGHVVDIQSGANNITLRNVILTSAGPDGDVLKISHASNVVVENSDLSRPGTSLDGSDGGWQQVIEVINSDDVVIQRNWIHDFGNLGGIIKAGSSGARIQQNLIDGQRNVSPSDPAWGIGGWTDTSVLGDASYEAVNTDFSHNVIAHAFYGALGLYDAYSTTMNNNLFLNNEGVVLEMRAGNASEQANDTIQFINNQIVDTRGQLPNTCEVQSHEVRGLVASGNTYWNNNQSISTDSDCGFTPTAESGAQIRDVNIVDTHPTSYEEAMALVDSVH